MEHPDLRYITSRIGLLRRVGRCPDGVRATGPTGRSEKYSEGSYLPAHITNCIAVSARLVVFRGRAMRLMEE